MEQNPYQSPGNVEDETVERPAESPKQVFASARLWAMVGFGLGTLMVSPIILSIDAIDRVLGGMVCGGIPLGLVGAVYGIHRAKR